MDQTMGYQYTKEDHITAKMYTRVNIIEHQDQFLDDAYLYISIYRYLLSLVLMFVYALRHSYSSLPYIFRCP